MKNASLAEAPKHLSTTCAASNKPDADDDGGATRRCMQVRKLLAESRGLSLKLVT